MADQKRTSGVYGPWWPHAVPTNCPCRLMHSCRDRTNGETWAGVGHQCVLTQSYATLTVRLAHGTAEAVTLLLLHSSKVLLPGLSGSAHLQLQIETHTVSAWWTTDDLQHGCDPKKARACDSLRQRKLVQICVCVERVELSQVEKLFQGLINEDEADESSEGLLCESSDVTHQGARVSGNQHQAQQGRP